MRLGKREQIVIYGIAGLATALAVHMMVFSKKTEAFKNANNQMLQAEQSLRNLKKPQSPLQLTRYSDETTALADQFQEMVEELKLPLNPIWLDASPEAFEKQMADILGLLDALRERRARGEAEDHTTLVFLGEGQYFWNFPTQLPGTVQRGEQNLYDLLTRLLGNLKSVRASEGSDPAFREEQFQQYAQTLALLDINYYLDFNQYAGWTQRPIPALFEIYQQVGPPVPFLKMMEHARLYLENQPDDVRDELKSRESLMELLGLNADTGKRNFTKVPDILDPTAVRRPQAGADPNARASSQLVDINVPWHTFLFHRIQLSTLIELIDLADNAGVSSISFVRLRSEQEIVPMSELVMVEATATPEVVVQNNYNDEWFDDSGGWGNASSTWASATPTPAPNAGSNIFATPIDMVLTGSNQAVSQFLYDISTARLPVELDSVKINSVLDPQTGQATLTATISVNVLAVVDQVTH